MGMIRPAQIVICSDDDSSIENVRTSLEQAGHSVVWHPLRRVLPGTITQQDLLILEGSRRDQEALKVCVDLRVRLSDHFVPILMIGEQVSDFTRQIGLECGADVCMLRPFSNDELLAQVHSLLRLKRLHSRLSEKTAEFDRINKRLQQTYQQLDLELELARRIQQSMLPQTLPVMPPISFAVHYRPCGRVGGDFYDVFRLDENHVGFYIADVMGHGVPASLLTIFLKKAVKPKEISGREYRLLPPDQVLAHLNQEMIAQQLAENPFITMIYGLFDRRNCVLTFARAGHPYPLHVPRHGEPELWKIHGTLLGVFETQFTVQTQQLRPGDKVLLYTDGLDGTTDGMQNRGTENLVQLATRHRALPVAAFVEQLSRELFENTDQPDDFTMLGLQIEE